MRFMDDFNSEANALTRQLEAGEISQAEYDQKIKAAWQDMSAESDRRDIIEAGRGHLVK